MCDFVFSESSRCLHCKNPQCKASCPVGFDVPTFMQLANSGRFGDAVQVVGHIFGEVCGYVCPRDKQCKGNCILGKRGNPIDVGKVERQVFANASVEIRQQSQALSHMKVVVVGGGVSGVTFAVQCVKHGAKVTVFEKNSLLHTIKSIPDFRLPQEALKRILTALENSAITVEKREIVASDVDNLLSQFDVVYLSTGVSVPHSMNVEGEQFATCADDFLRQNRFGKVIVVGGGNTAMDCARLNARHGQSVVAYRRSRQDMPAFDTEVDAAMQENVQFFFNLAPVKIEKTSNGLCVTFARTVSEGRGRLTITDQTLQLCCDQIVSATGNGFDKNVYAVQRFVEIDENNHVKENLYAGGDATGKSMVAQAVADALNACRAVLEKYGNSH